VIALWGVLKSGTVGNSLRGAGGGFGRKKARNGGKVLKSGTVDNSLRVAGGGFERKNAENGGKTPGFRPIQATGDEFLTQWSCPN